MARRPVAGQQVDMKFPASGIRTRTGQQSQVYRVVSWIVTLMTDKRARVLVESRRVGNRLMWSGYLPEFRASDSEWLRNAL